MNGIEKISARILADAEAEAAARRGGKRTTGGGGGRVTAGGGGGACTISSPYTPQSDE